VAQSLISPNRQIKWSISPKEEAERLGGFMIRATAKEG